MKQTDQPIPGHDGETMTVVSGETSWRLIYVDGVALSLFQSSGKTMTKRSVFTAATKQECLDQAIQLNLDMTAIPTP